MKATVIILISIIIVILIIAWLTFNHTTILKVGMCPSEDIVMVFKFPDSSRPIMIPKGILDNPDNFWTLDEWNKGQQEWRRNQGL